MSTIREIQGSLVFIEIPLSSFPYLRNLKIVGSNNSVPYGERFSFILFGNDVSQLVELDLSSLQEIQGYTIVATGNPQLCYVGDLAALARNANLSIHDGYRRSASLCIADGLVCHPQCDSLTSCWGPNDTQCDGCRHFSFGRRCVQNCSEQETGLTASDAGVYQNNSTLVCEPCHQQCVGGCFNGTGAENCHACRTYFVRVGIEGGHHNMCVDTCPMGMYLNRNSSECLPCHTYCSPELGCAGPLPYVDRANGCLDCALVQLNRNGSQNTCVGACGEGFYDSEFTYQDQDISITGDLLLDTPVCRPCHELCLFCSGPELTQCTACQFASTQDGQCLRSCDKYNEYQDTRNVICQTCSSGCFGCTGPTSKDCLTCNPGFFNQSDGDQGFVCVSTCERGHYVSTGDVCITCDKSCKNCVGPGPSNCTSCAEQYMAAVVSPGGVSVCVSCNGNDCENVTQNRTNTIIAVTVVTVFIAVTAIFTIYFCFYKKMRKKQTTTIEKCSLRDLSNNNSETKTSEVVPSNKKSSLSPEFIIPECQITLGKIVGQGEFGIVYEGHLWRKHNNVKVAIKTLKGFFQEDVVDNFLKECSKMTDFNHPNVMELYGVCLDSGSNPFLVLPFMVNGNLLDHLKNRRKELVLSLNQDIDDKLVSVQKMLLDICLQISKGMEYLTSKKIIHRDLAARNCMISANFVIKVSDFGLSETISITKDYFRQTEKGIKLPIKWLAPESIEDGIFSEKSDVWSFGITCWEVFSGGKQPYPGIHPLEVLSYINTGYRMKAPTNAACTKEIYKLMMNCWEFTAEERPTFSELVIQTDSLIMKCAEYLQLLLK